MAECGRPGAGVEPPDPGGQRDDRWRPPAAGHADNRPRVREHDNRVTALSVNNERAHAGFKSGLAVLLSCLAQPSAPPRRLRPPRSACTAAALLPRVLPPLLRHRPWLCYTSEEIKEKYNKHSLRQHPCRASCGGSDWFGGLAGT